MRGRQATLSTCSCAELPRAFTLLPLWAPVDADGAARAGGRVTVNSKHLSDVVPYEFCGEIAILRDCMCTATVVAQSPVTLVALPRAAFYALIDSSPQVRQR